MWESEESVAFTELDMTKYPRKAQFDYFRSLAYPYLGLTVEVDITDFLRLLQEREAPFFLSFSRAVTRAANAVEAFRQRIRGDGIVTYNWCPGSVTLATPDGNYCYCTLPCRECFDDYLPHALETQERALAAASIEDGEDAESLLFLSSIPWLHYTALTQPVPHPADSNPRITWGKYFTREGRTRIPVSVLCNHALMDARQLADFYEALERELSCLE